MRVNRVISLETRTHEGRDFGTTELSSCVDAVVWYWLWWWSSLCLITECTFCSMPFANKQINKKKRNPHWARVGILDGDYSNGLLAICVHDTSHWGLYVLASAPGESFSDAKWQKENVYIFALLINQSIVFSHVVDGKADSPQAVVSPYTRHRKADGRRCKKHIQSPETIEWFGREEPGRRPLALSIWRAFT